MSKQMKNEPNKNTLGYKLATVLVTILIFALLVGSVGGLIYLFSPKDHTTAHAEEISGSVTEEVNTAIISVNWEYRASRMYIDGGALNTPLPVFLQQPLIVRTNNDGLSLDYYKWVSNGTVCQLQSYWVYNFDNFYVDMATTANNNLRMYFECLNSETDFNFSKLVQVHIEYVYGSQQLINFTIYDDLGNRLIYEVYPYRIDEIGGDWSLNYASHISINQVYNVSTATDISQLLQDYYDLGFERGEDYGYDNGYERGKDVGYQNGANDAHQFTFAKLLDAVFYAPIKAFTSIFNFEILGVNMLSIMSFILTIAIVVGLLKWLL